MKTTLQHTGSAPRLRDQSSTHQAPAAAAQGSRPIATPIDFARRRANRSLRTPQLLALLRTEAPRFYDLAEVVGSWVWIQFTEKQPAAITAALAELGFHWNPKRQAWQHPCGAVTAGSPHDPRAKYGSQHPADLQPA